MSNPYGEPAEGPRRLDLEGMSSRRIQIEDVNDAFRAMRDGEVIRPVIDFK
jgi:Zn-dependent alcohol dehydrogenase